jgi:hypothetical protein
MFLQNDKTKQLDLLWALRKFDELRAAGCQRDPESSVWELWEDRAPARLDDAITRVLMWTSKGKP